MADIFISHVEEDADVALAIADALEAAGFSTWYYERDSTPGAKYLIEVGEQIDQAKAVLLLISSAALSSNEVTVEVARAHIRRKPFLPILRGVSDAGYKRRQPEWETAMGTTVSVPLPEAGVDEGFCKRIVRGATGLCGERAPQEPAQLRTPVVPASHAPLQPDEAETASPPLPEPSAGAASAPDALLALTSDDRQTPKAAPHPARRRPVRPRWAVAAAAMLVVGVSAGWILVQKHRTSSAGAAVPGSQTAVTAPQQIGAGGVPATGRLRFDGAYYQIGGADGTRRFYPDGAVYALEGPPTAVSDFPTPSHHKANGRYDVSGGTITFDLKSPEGRVEYTGVIRGDVIEGHWRSLINGQDGQFSMDFRPVPVGQAPPVGATYVEEGLATIPSGIEYAQYYEFHADGTFRRYAKFGNGGGATNEEKGSYSVKGNRISFATVSREGKVVYSGRITPTTLDMTWHSHINGSNGSGVFRLLDSISDEQ